MVSNISESQLIMLITEALSEPLPRWVKDYNPITFQYVISRTRDLQYFVEKNKLPKNPTHLPENKEKPTNLLDNKDKIIP